MRILVAPGAFKGTLSADRAARAMEKGALRAAPDARVERIPLADGGDGFLAAISARRPLDTERHFIAGPCGGRISAPVGWEGKRAYVESAQVIGLGLVPLHRRNPLRTTSFGLGELVRRCLDRGARKVFLGLGGTATVDGGLGALIALGVEARDRHGRKLLGRGEDLCRLARLDCTRLDRRLRSVPLVCLWDVANPLVGPSGAARVFGPQKGADRSTVARLEAGLVNFARQTKQSLGVDVRRLRGGGAAGGIGAFFCAFLRARLESGSEFVGEESGLRSRVRHADLVLTAEGKLDAQTRRGKTVALVGRLSREKGVPAFAFAATVEDVHIAGITAAFSILDKPRSYEKTVGVTEQLIAHTVESAVRAFLAGARG